jgi:peptidoglycan/xylan/chitin deacetylase (PgdA/CDA1 family)
MRGTHETLCTAYSGTIILVLCSNESRANTNKHCDIFLSEIDVYYNSTYENKVTMSLHHKVLTYLNPVLWFIRKFAVLIGVVSKNRLRVLIFHDVPAEEEEAFSSQLRWLSKEWRFVSPSEFEEMITGNTPILGDNLLITFDDGFSSNRTVVENILNPMGIKAVFFIISDFLMIDDVGEAKKFIAENIIPGTKVSDLPNEWGNMNVSDVKALVKQGHTIGCHTKTHAKLNTKLSLLDVENEINTSADALEEILGVKVKHFAYTFGDVESFSEAAMQIAKQRFRFVYSGLRGNNANNVSPYSIRRDAAANQNSKYEYSLFNNNLLSSFLDGYSDFRYSDSKKTLDQWIK